MSDHSRAGPGSGSLCQINDIAGICLVPLAERGGCRALQIAPRRQPDFTVVDRTNVEEAQEREDRDQRRYAKMRCIEARAGREVRWLILFERPNQTRSNQMRV